MGLNENLLLRNLWRFRMLDDFRSQADTPFFNEDNQPENLDYETETRREFLG